MKKLIKLSFKNTSSIREIEDSYSEVYSHDRNNGNFEFEIQDESLTDERVIALFKFLKSKKVWKTEGRIEEGVIKVKFDNTLITRDESVVCYLYLDGSEVDSDVFKFKFDVKLSEIDKVNDLPEKERYFKNSIVVDRNDVLTRDVLDEEVVALKKSFVVRDDLTGLINQEALTQAKTDVLDEVNKLGFIKQHQDLSGYAKSTEIPDVSGFVKNTDLTALKTEILNEVDGEGFLKQHQSLDGLLTKEVLDKELEKVVGKIPQPNLTDYVTTAALNEKLQDLVSNLPTPDLSGLVKEKTFDDFKKTVVTTNALNDKLDKSEFDAFKSTVNTSGGSEIRGNGAPYGKTAALGTIYVDEQATNGAMRWLKTKDLWKVIDGDTGWVNVSLNNIDGRSKMQVRRVNDLVYARFFNELDEGLVKIHDYSSNLDSSSHYIRIGKDKLMSGFLPTNKLIQPILPEIVMGNNEYSYGYSQQPYPFLRLTPKGGFLQIELLLDEFSVTNSNFGIYINAFSYLTDDRWPTNLTF